MNLAEALQSLFPGSDPQRDYVLQDDGRGAYIALWNIESPRPTVAELAALGATEGSPVARENDFISDVRAANRAIWDALNQLAALRREWTALDYGNTLDVGVGENAGVAPADVQAVLFTTGEAVDSFLAAGFHYTGMAKLL